ncbi:TatD family hydrolase [Halegenticoccus tardaugens]|uniref:TatD family hydrolase n=1 Tax=Halegenticoccus tardaugens TaxID=2071624 RepID=UPI00100B4111|nr:TatD family hydrolase [Halegenticoccus tardaugens]
MGDSDYPTKRPTAAITDEAVAYERPYPAEAKEIPWIDIHQHTGTLSWDHHEKMDASGARAVVMIAASYFQVPYRPIRADDWRFLWDEALRRAGEISRNHFFDVHLATGIHFGARIEGTDELLDVLPDYCDLDEVVAVGETGIDPVQSVSTWSLDDQRAVLAEQMRIADEHGLPVILHTPADRDGSPGPGSVPAQFGRTFDHKFDYGGSPEADPAPGFDLANAKLEAAKMDVAVADEVGLPPERVVIDHGHPDIAPYVLGETGCYLSFSLVRKTEAVAPEDVAAVIDEYGSERVLVDSDLLAGLYADDAALTMRRMTLDLLRLGVDPADVKNVVYENPKAVLGL